MAWKTSIAEAMAEGLGVLLDTNVLIGAAKEGLPGGPLRTGIIQIHQNRRFVTELVLWEFLCHANIPHTTRARRRTWLRDHRIQLHPQPAGYHGTLQALSSIAAARGGGVDAQLAAYSVSKRGRLAIATNNVRDFCWHQLIPLLDEFIDPANATPMDCST